MPDNKRTVKGALGGLLGLVGLSVIAGVLVTASVTPALAMTGIAGSRALTLFDELPSYLEVDAPMAQSNIWATDANGKNIKLASFYDQNRVPVTFEQINPVMYDAILSSEDKNFYSHGGVNLGATVKAVVDNVRGVDDRGASTISQQFVKNVLIQKCEQGVVRSDYDLDPNDPETPEDYNADQAYADDLRKCWLEATTAAGSKGIERKLQEMRFAIQIEKDYAKNDILLGYLNIASFGGTVYGIEAAANYYFKTTAANLTLAQAATLAGIVQNPNTYRIDQPGGSWTDKHGTVHNSAEDGYATAKDRRHYVLGRMLADGKITQAQYDEADAADIVPDIGQPTQGCAAAGANGYFCQYVKSVIKSDEAFGATQEERDNLLRLGGIDIYTTLDFRVQNPAVESMRERVPANDGKFIGAAGVSIGTDGAILAMTQNTTFSETIKDDPAYSAQVYSADRAHGGGIGFQVGSTYKLFTLIDWLEKGRSVNEVLNGVNRLYTKIQCDGQNLWGNSKKIENFNDQRGYTGTVMKFTKDSLNSGYLAMAEQLDICDINKVAMRMGVSMGDGSDFLAKPAPFDILGSKNISAIDMAGAYATVANNGVYCTPRAITKVLDREGNELELPKSSCTQVISPEVAATAAYALEGVMRGGGTGSRANTNDGTPLIGKTGTHEKWHTMMVESSSKVATAVWVGRSKGTEPIRRQYYNGTQLSDVRYYLARDLQRAANAVYGGDRFPQPDRNLTRTVLTDLPNVVGQTIDDATKTLETAGFSVNVGPAVDADAPTNVVAAQDPAGGKVAGGTSVTISPSNGQGAPADVPNVEGDDLQKAQRKLASAGFTSIAAHGSCNAEDAEVSGTNPPAGSSVNKRATITVMCN